MGTNIVIEVGNLTRDAELKYTQSGTAILKFSIAVNRQIPPKRDGEEWGQETSFFDVQLWGKLAESKRELANGDKVIVNGRLKQYRWEQDGKQRSMVYIEGESVGVLYTQRAVAPRDESASGNRSHVQSATDAKSSPPRRDGDNFDDDIPF